MVKGSKLAPNTWHSLLLHPIILMEEILHVTCKWPSLLGTSSSFVLPHFSIKYMDLCATVVYLLHQKYVGHTFSCTPPHFLYELTSSYSNTTYMHVL
jgi:hypothetical protein